MDIDFTPEENSAKADLKVPAGELIDRIQIVVEEALESGQALEMEPARGKLFAVFADAYQNGHTGEDAALSSDELTRSLGQRWGLDQSAKQSVADQKKMSETDLAKMRLLWSTLRMWMEWDYAWTRYEELGGSQDPKRPR